MTKNTGGPAHPTLSRSHIPGMTLRDYFAGQVLAGVCANTDMEQDRKSQLASAVYELADAMIAEREK